MKFKVGDEVKVKNSFDFCEEYRGKQFIIEECDSSDDTYLCHPTTGGYRIWFSEEKLEPADSKILRMADGTIIGEFKGIPVYATSGTVSIHDLPTSEWYNPMRLTFKNGSSIEALPQKDNTFRGENHFCDGFRGGKKPEHVLNEKQAKEYADNIMATVGLISDITGISYENSINKLKTCLGAFPNNGISAKNGGKNSMKFTFYTVEGYRMDKSNNTKIPTVTTEVVYKDKDGCATGGSATCDKADYNSRQGVLEALANMCCGGNFDREYNKAVKDNARADKISRTCTYCGQIFDTVAEKEAHEAWHVERRKARHERYLLRKRAKEIAFEEQAQKMAKEMIEAKK